MTPDAPPATDPARPRWWLDALWLALLAAWTAGWCLSAAPRLGPTYDEPLYIDAGLQSWRGWTRDDDRPRGFEHEGCAVNGVMPLPIDALGLPLYVGERRSDEKLDNPEKKMAALPRARATTLGWLWLLVFSAWRLGRAAGGPWAGRIVAGLLAADPNFLGHASLATTDVCAAATLMAFTRAVYAGRGGGWWNRLVLPGLWFGLAALSKVSALLYGGIILVVLEVSYRFATKALSRPPGGDLRAWALRAGGATLRSVSNAAAILAIGISLAMAYFGIPDEGRRPFVSVAGSVPKDEPLKEIYLRWAEGSGRVPHAVCAFAFQWWWNAHPRPSFLDGTYYPKGYRYFFPVVLLMKVPLPVFALALVALARARRAVNPFALLTLVLLVTLLKANLQLGVRLAFPVIALGYVAVAVGVARAYPRCAGWLGLAAVLPVAAASALVWPHGLGYVNRAWGGPDAAPRLVADSNHDWGQGLPELKAWHAANGSPRLAVWYFGGDPAITLPPFERIPMEGLPIADEKDLRAAVGRRVLAVGDTVTTLHPDAPPAKAVALKCLRGRTPLARTATFTLYDFRDDP